MELVYNVYRQLQGTATDIYSVELTEEEYKDFLEEQEELNDLELLKYVREKYQHKEKYIDTEYDDQGGKINLVEFITD